MQAFMKHKTMMTVTKMICMNLCVKLISLPPPTQVLCYPMYTMLVHCNYNV